MLISVINPNVTKHMVLGINDGVVFIAVTSVKDNVCTCGVGMKASCNGSMQIACSEFSIGPCTLFTSPQNLMFKE